MNASLVLVEAKSAIVVGRQCSVKMLAGAKG
jgi:hypothetical protein